MFEDRKESLSVVIHPVRVRPIVHAVVPYNKQYIIQSHRSTPRALALCVDGWTRPGDGDGDRGAPRTVCVRECEKSIPPPRRTFASRRDDRSRRPAGRRTI